MDKKKVIILLGIMAMGVFYIMYNDKMRRAIKYWKELGAIPPLDLKRYRITSGFGIRIHPITKLPQFHNGIDIATPEETLLIAPYDGYVKVWENSVGGLQLAIYDRKGKLRIGFAHLRETFVQNGDDVQKGWTIATTGNTGRTTGPHLHLTVKFEGIYLDPEKFFKGVGVL